MPENLYLNAIKIFLRGSITAADLYYLGRVRPPDEHKEREAVHAMLRAGSLNEVIAISDVSEARRHGLHAELWKDPETGVTIEIGE